MVFKAVPSSLCESGFTWFVEYPLERPDAMATSIYRPLPNDNDTFRLILIHPAADPNEKIEVSLVVTELNDRPDYEALSYVWGPHPSNSIVTVKGQELSIRTSLYEFLAVLRDETHGRLVYADAICINQADSREKESQVQMMGRIFQGARLVLSYLGPGDDGTDAVLRGSSKVRTDDYTITKEDNSEGERGFWREGIFEEAEFDILKPAMVDLVNRDYWKRAWIIQECLIAEEVHLYCGHMSTPWEKFLNMYMLLIDKEPKAKVYTWGYTKPEWTTITRFDHIAGQRSRREKFPCHLADIVTYFNAAESADPRDMVYAFLGLMKESNPDHPRRLMADYTISPVELYFLAGHAYIYSPDSGRPHRILFGLIGMLGLTAGEVLQAICELIDPDELVSPVDWITGHLTDEEKNGRVFRDERRPEEVPYMECFERDFSTLIGLLRERKRRQEGFAEKAAAH